MVVFFFELTVFTPKKVFAQLSGEQGTDFRLICSFRCVKVEKKSRNVTCPCVSVREGCVLVKGRRGAIDVCCVHVCAQCVDINALRVNVNAKCVYVKDTCTGLV